MMKWLAGLLVFALGACATPERGRDRPRFTHAQVESTADKFAQQKGYDVRKYTKVSYYQLVSAHTWAVFYEPKPGTYSGDFGGDFIVYVDDRTREIWLMLGH